MMHVVTFCCILMRLKSSFLIRLNHYTTVLSVQEIIFILILIQFFY